MHTEIFLARSDSEIESCFPVFQTLRPQLSAQDFLERIRRQEQQSYQIAALKNHGKIKSVAGFRFAEFLAWGKILYLDDLGTLPDETGQGYAGTLLDWLTAHAQTNGCQAIHLDSGYTRHVAHRLYLNKGFALNGHHLAHQFNQTP